MLTLTLICLSLLVGSLTLWLALQGFRDTQVRLGEAQVKLNDAVQKLTDLRREVDGLSSRLAIPNPSPPEAETYAFLPEEASLERQILQAEDRVLHEGPMRFSSRPSTTSGSRFAREPSTQRVRISGKR